MITRLGNPLFVNIPAVRFRLYAETAKSFYAKGGGGTVHFIKGNTGKVTGLNQIIDTAAFFKRLIRTVRYLPQTLKSNISEQKNDNIIPALLSLH